MEIDENSNKQPFTVYIEGNVGAGKSTLLNYFKKFDDLLVLEEPIEKWKNLHGFNLLDLKFNDAKFQFPFQNYATLTRLQQHLETTDKPIKVMERSLLTARRCFVQNIFENGTLHAGDYHVLNEWYNFINEYHPIRCDFIVYLRTSPSVALTRVRKRAREEEKALTDEYLLQIHNRYESLLSDPSIIPGVKLIVIDADMNSEDMISQFEQCYEEIKKSYLTSIGRPDNFIQI